ncbi:HAMP domain-containing sensor histidine kinase [Sporosarcina sp. Te-1]|uniref:sensor histidine kinase n=1 Tax=Sporosarcina sp. Te-1 TaxID=2818390 RepID=UPI001A9F521D|nr:HAMP domain-containing sensor histidine kinase [Sporosarcina sp. Te-1]QTD40982.1 HAMP domain-containing histidine kinase [Sporosarcina sp. Te-1]
MNRISTKLTAYFFITVLIMETSLMLYLHRNIIDSRTEEEFNRLLANGSNHRDVLTTYYSETTMKHIVLMEKDGDREVLITNTQGEIIASSAEEEARLSKYLTPLDEIDAVTDQIIDANWRDMPYIISVHPYSVDSGQSGYVIMFQSTASIKQLVAKLNMYFGMAGVTSVTALFIIYALLSKFLTRPLIRMKEATEKLSKGDFHVSLPSIGKDELGELSGSIQKLANDLERLTVERNEFLASTAHELSTPLTYLNGYSKVAMRQGIPEDERNRYLEIIAEESERMKELVNNLLDLAKLDENSFTVCKEYFWAKTFIHHVIKLVEPSFAIKKLELEVVMDEDFQMYADPIRLEQIVLNLLDNALKYSNEESTVTLEVYKKEDKTVLVITDKGIGIPEQDLAFIFEKLYRVEKSRSRSFGGSGIGLSVVKELVDAHGGSIEVASQLGKGSTFTVTL